MSMDPYESPQSRSLAFIQFTRRNFLVVIGAFGALIGLVFAGFISIKFLFPNATLEQPPEFKLAVDPSTITVDNPYMDYGHRVGVIRDDAGYYAVQLICTHLGCTPNYVADVISGSGAPESRALERGDRTQSERIPNGWACPCHGSRYFIDSTNFYGPAPRPMDWVGMAKSPDGFFLINRGDIVVLRNPGDTTPPTWRFDFESGQVVQVPAGKLVNS